MNHLEHHYEIIVYWRDEDQQYIAEVPELPGCRAVGPSRRDALTNAEHAIALWVSTAHLSGDPVPQAQGRLLTH
ncbi:MAG: hypothetical protein QOE70_1733 [Chthoniobacter sp.]|jgi:predicted RNase H-like HicB family nuclease|nr:hypothetical protein [Chthoniobacter sp.]